MSEGSRTSPIVVIAAVSMIIFSVVGVGVMTGLIPSSKSGETDIKTVEAAKANTAAPAPHSSTASSKQRTRVAAAHTDPAREPVRAPMPSSPTASAPVPVAAAPQICMDCGVIDSINVVEQKGQGSGLGAAGGAVVGGLLGHQVGSGRGNTAATVVGAVGGAVVGNEVEKRVKTTKQYNVSVRMDDGNFKTFTFDSQPTFVVGEKVKVIDGRLLRS